MIPFIAPDKPIRTSVEFLNDLDIEDWSIEMKLDGYRIEISKDNNIVTARSRHGLILNIDSYFYNYFNKIMDNGWAIDAEWVNHNRIKAINKNLNANLPLIECIGVHDITWINGKYVGNSTLKERRNCDLYNIIPFSEISNLSIFRIPILSSGSILNFYNMQADIKMSEGIVIKKLSSKLIGSKTQSVKNPSWYKIKYRN